MNIALLSYTFDPHIGGIETVSAALAESLATLGHRVVVITKSPGASEEIRTYAVLRDPSSRRLFLELASADAIVQSNWSLRLCWPLYLLRKPVLNVTHIWLSARSEMVIVKRLLLAPFAQGAVSHSIGRHLEPLRSTVLANPYQDGVFFEMGLPRVPGSLLFVGRLERNKGPNLLLRAVFALRSSGTLCTLTIVGGGALQGELEHMVAAVGGSEAVRIVGPKTPGEIATLMNEHEIVVVPSVWQEPFGMVAVEGLACGCKLVVTTWGGLSEAAGGHAETCANGDVHGLCNAIRRALAHTVDIQESAAIRRHLARMTRAAAGCRYEAVLHRLVDEAAHIH